MSEKTTTAFGVLFVVMGLLGYVDNPLMGPLGIFATNNNHNLAHLLAGPVLLLAARRSTRTAIRSLYAVGAVYGLLAVVGFAGVGEEGQALLFGKVYVNDAGNWMHTILAVALIAAAWAVSRTYRSIPMPHASLRRLG